MKKKDKEKLKIIGSILLSIILILCIVFFSDISNYLLRFHEGCGNWDYAKINALPCIRDGQMFGILSENLNISLSPQENCESHNGDFLGFNFLIEERNQEIIDKIKPTC